MFWSTQGKNPMHAPTAPTVHLKRREWRSMCTLTLGRSPMRAVYACTGAPKRVTWRVTWWPTKPTPESHARKAWRTYEKWTKDYCLHLVCSVSAAKCIYLACSEAGKRKWEWMQSRGVSLGDVRSTVCAAISVTALLLVIPALLRNMSKVNSIYKSA